MPFVSIPFTTDLVTLVDGALDRLQEHWEDWEPNDGDLEVIVIEALGPIAQDAIETAALVPSAIFREFGLVMAGEAYQQPQPAPPGLMTRAQSRSPWRTWPSSPTTR
jgi:hypothetical protein